MQHSPVLALLYEGGLSAETTNHDKTRISGEGEDL